jgi:PAS domain S-box-containing protein
MKMRQSIIRDLSKEKEEETKLMLLSSAMDAAVDSIIILDLKGCVIELNDSAMRMLGIREKSEVIGEYWSKKVADPNTIGFLETQYKQLIQDGYVSDVTTRVRRHDGSTIPIEVTAAIIKDPTGNPRAIITVSRDVTEKQHLAESLRKRDRLLHAMTSSIFEMFDSDDPRLSLDNMIQTLGESADVSRCYVCAIDRSGDGPIRASIVSAWTREGTRPSSDEMRSTVYVSEGFERWNKTLSMGGIVHGPVATFPGPERRRLAEMSTRSILVAPVMLQGEWIGIMGLDDCAEDKLWSQQEINILRVTAKIASHLLERSSAVPPHLLVAGHPVE